jgi:Skp family chaperone for outer membrane proteins
MKKIGFLTLLILAIALATLAFTAAAAPKAATMAAPAALAAPMPVPHPHIQAALEAMHNAHHELEDASHEFHGHREEAIKHLDAAMHEAEICRDMP